MGEWGSSHPERKERNAMVALAPTFETPSTTCAPAARPDASLSERERALALLTTVLVLADHHLIEQATVCAQAVGLTQAEIAQTRTLVLAVQEVCQCYGLPGAPV